jgi:opacity protein-like surface antigen
MKKITILTVILSCSIGVFAQFNQGRMLVGGSAEFRTNTDKSKNGGTTVTNGNLTSLSIAPQFGYFIIDHVAVGAAINLGVSKWNSKSPNNSDRTTTSIEFQPFARYYLPIPIFFQAKFGLGTSKTSYDRNPEDTYHTTSLALSAGYAIFLTDNIALEPEVGYRTSRFKATDSNTKDIDAGLFLRIGFQLYFGK